MGNVHSEGRDSVEGLEGLLSESVVLLSFERLDDVGDGSLVAEAAFDGGHVGGDDGLPSLSVVGASVLENLERLVVIEVRSVRRFSQRLNQVGQHCAADKVSGNASSLDIRANDGATSHSEVLA